MKRTITDTYIYSFNPSTAQTDIEYTGHLTEYTEKRIGSRHDYAITDVVFFLKGSGYRRFTVALPAGISLYLYLSRCQRRERIKDITFKFTVITETQKIISFKAYDPTSWIGGDVIHEQQKVGARL